LKICPKNEEYFIKSFLKIYLLITINYSSSEEILNTMKNIETKVMNREINIDDISEGLISKELYTNKFPGPDLLI
jgi:undecaprenyl diphosphate synthase